MDVKFKVVIRPNSPVAEIYKDMAVGMLPGRCPVFLCKSLDQGMFGFVKIQILKARECPEISFHTIQIPVSEILLISDDPEPEQYPIGFLQGQ